MATRISREKAAQAWCTPTTSNKEMDTELAEAFAEILDDIWSRPWLGNATTGELLDEIKARVNCSYRTADCVGPLDAAEWKERYKKRLMERGGLTEKEAEENFQAGDLPDFNYKPEDLADDEMSYWEP